MEIAFGDRAPISSRKLVDTFGDEVQGLCQRASRSGGSELAEIGDFVYKNVFLYYTQKQWGVSPDEVDPSITARPVYISRDNRYFQDQYQGMPAMGYTKLFENMLDHENIEVCLNTEAESVFDLVFEDGSEDACIKEIRLHDRAFTAPSCSPARSTSFSLARFGRLPTAASISFYETFDEEHHFPLRHGQLHRDARLHA